MSDLTQRVIDRYAWRTRFHLEVLLIRDDFANGYSSRHVYDRQTRDLAREYCLPVWLVRACTEGEAR